MSATATSIPVGNYVADPVHGLAAFAVPYMGVSTFRGSFRELEADLSVDDAGALTLNGAVAADSVDVHDANLAGHLQSPEFFDAANHPQVTFVSRTLELHEDGTLSLEGDFTIKGNTRPVNASGTWTKPGEDQFGKTRVGVTLTAVIDRQEFGLQWNAPLPKGGLALADEVTLTVELPFVYQGGEA